MRIAVPVLMSFALLSAGAAHAQDGDDEDSRQSAPTTRFEVTPFVGYRFGGDFDLDDPRRSVDLNDHGSFALALNLRADDYRQYELFYSRQETRLQPDSSLGGLGINVEYLQLGGTLQFDETDQWPLKPYMVGGLGVTRFTPEPDSSDSTRFSVSLGAGLRVPVTTHFGLRLEARGFLTLVNTDSAFFCASGSSGGVCAIRGSGSSFVQYELLAGAAFAF
jgi:opacity protein-like surface antigen